MVSRFIFFTGPIDSLLPRCRSAFKRAAAAPADPS